MTDQVEQDVALDDDGIEISEMQDAKNTEEASVASVKKAEGAGKSAAKRKGDKANSDKSDLKTGGKASGLQAEDMDFSEDLEALMDEEATLSEGFKGKAAIIFEAAMKSKLSEEIERLEENYATTLQEEVDTFKADMVEKVDGYLNYVVENWMKENELAIQSGIRTEIAEEFMDKLQTLFTESYIAVPDSKVDLVDDLANQNSSLEEKLDAQTEDMIAMKEELESFKRYEIIREAARNLAQTEVEKLVKLSEDIDFVSEEVFASKVETIKEAYFKKEKAATDSIIEDVADVDDGEVQDLSESMGQYLKALRKTQY